MLKPSHFKTPRQMRDCWEDTRLGANGNSGLSWVWALGIGVLIGLMLGWRG
jgi:hypothetical protein